MNSINKKALIFSIPIMLLALLFGGWSLLYGQRNGQNVPKEPAVVSERPIQMDWKVYTVGNFKFQINFPVNINSNLIISEEKVKQKDSFYGSSSESILRFTYPLDEAVSRSSEEPGLGKLNEMAVWYIDVVPVADWREGVCNGKYLCRQGKVLARNSSFVFEAGFMNIEGAGELCANQEQVQKNFCKSYKDLINFVESGDFKFVLK